MCCKPKYRANIIHHFIFVFFRYFFYHSSCRKGQIIVLSLKFGFQDFTDPGLLRKILRSLTGCRCGFAFTSVSVSPKLWYSGTCSPSVFESWWNMKMWKAQNRAPALQARKGYGKGLLRFYPSPTPPLHGLRLPCKLGGSWGILNTT